MAESNKTRLYVSANYFLAETYKRVLFDSATGQNVKKKVAFGQLLVFGQKTQF
jgi:hypothetical protein